MLVRFRSAERRAADDVVIAGSSDDLIGALSSGPRAVTFTPDGGSEVPFDSTVHAVVVDERGVARAVVAAAKPRPEPEPSSEPAPSFSWRWCTWAVIGLFVVAATATAALRPYWYDESWSLAFAGRPVRSWAPLIEFGEVNMVGYHVLLKGWVGLFGADPLASRLLSIVAAASAGALVYAIGARSWTGRVGFGAAVLFVTSTSVLMYSQQARSYALATTGVTLSMLLLLRWRDSRRPALLLLWALVAGATGWLHVFGAFAVFGQFAGAFVATRRSRARLLGAGVLAGLLLIPVGYFLAFGSGGGSQVQWIEDPTWRSALDVAVLITGGRGVLAAALVILLVIAARRGRRVREPETTDRGRFAYAVCVGAIVGPVLCATALTVLDQPLIVPRYFLVSLPAVMLLAAAGARRLLGDLWTAAILLLAITGLLYQAEFVAGRPAWDGEAAAAVIAAESQHGDGLMVVPAWARVDLAWHLADADRTMLDGLDPVYPAMALGTLSPMTDLTDADTPDMVHTHLGELDRVWVVQVQGTPLPQFLEQELDAFPVRGETTDVAAYSVRLYERGS